MKLLFITPSFPWPPKNGHELIAFSQMKHLSMRHEIDLISFANSEAPDTTGLGGLCANIRVVRFQRWRAWISKVCGLFKKRPLQASYFYSKQMVKVVEAALRENSYDAVVFYTTAMAQYLPQWYSGKSIWFMVDPLVLSNERFLDRCSGWQRLVSLNRIVRLKRFERRYAKNFDRIILVSKADIHDYQGRLEEALFDWVPHGLDVDIFHPDLTVPRESGMIVITGNMNYPPNVDAIETFCRDVFPLICRLSPAANLWLVGANPSAVKKWTKNPRIKATGFVPDVRPYLMRSMVSVCALHLSVGTQTKVLEAMACGTPVVTTPAGNNGVGAVSGLHLQVADIGAKFAESIVALLNGEDWIKLSENGREFVVAKFTLSISATRFEEVLEQVVGSS